MTNCQMLSNIVQTFDPRGLLTPVINCLKDLMQKTWFAKLGWDQKLPVDASQEYVVWRENLGCIEMMEVDRFVLKTDQLDIFDLHVICDATEHGYAACVFVVSQHNGERRSTLLLAVSSQKYPEKSNPITRLELCAAVPGCRLLSSVVESLQSLELNIDKTFAWKERKIYLL